MEKENRTALRGVSSCCFCLDKGLFAIVFTGFFELFQLLAKLVSLFSDFCERLLELLNPFS